MNILALDLGLTTGWAVSVDGRIESGVHGLDLKRGESPGMRYVRFRAWLAGWLAGPPIAHPLGLIVYEQAHHRGGAATAVAVNLAGRVDELCADRGVEYTSVHTATLKKYCTGHGNAGKAAMIAAVQERWGHKIADDNEADALALLHYSIEHFSG